MKLKIFFIVATILATLFIFNNSLQDASRSDADSDTIVSFFLGQEIKAKDPLRFVVTKIIRKSAHFLEFCLHGFLLTGCFSHAFKKRAPWILAIGLLTACTDEALQLLSDGRAAMIQDVFIDFFGTIAGLFLFFWVFKLKIRGNLRSDTLIHG